MPVLVSQRRTVVPFRRDRILSVKPVARACQWRATHPGCVRSCSPEGGVLKRKSELALPTWNKFRPRGLL